VRRLAAVFVLCVASGARADRPLVTDSARTAPRGTLQLETWGHLDRNGLQHFNLLAIGVTDFVEMAAGGEYGISLTEDDRTRFGAGSPLLQMKLRVQDPEELVPGIASVVGLVAPWGTGGFELRDWAPFVYGVVTFQPLSTMEVHSKLGFYTLPNDVKVIWGVAFEHELPRVRLIGEVFSGDPYAEESGIAFQGGFRFGVSPNVQIDVTFGSGLTGNPELPPYATLGLRLARLDLW
jgi:hypothetical protein